RSLWRRAPGNHRSQDRGQGSGDCRAGRAQGRRYYDRTQGQHRRSQETDGEGKGQVGKRIKGQNDPHGPKKSELNEVTGVVSRFRTAVNNISLQCRTFTVPYGKGHQISTVGSRKAWRSTCKGASSTHRQARPTQPVYGR